MKKLLAFILCLLLALPLYVYADEIENKPAQLTETQPVQPAETQPTQPAETQPTQPVETQPTQPTETQPTQPTESQPGDHTHVWDVSATVPATCLEEGATAYGCSACGAITYEILPKLTTHTYANACDSDCDVCGAGREASHKFSTQWTKNASGHWYACSACGEQKDFGKHYPGPAATEEKAQICLTCGYTMTAKLGHKYDTQWTSNADGHWYACAGCEERKDFAAHSYDNGCDSGCSVCGYQGAAGHIYSGSWLYDELGHWTVCTVCQEESSPEPHIPGQEATETQSQLCLACGMELAPALAPTEHIHVGEGVWETDTQNHWKLCACGEKTDEAAHIWDAGQEQEDGTVLYTCEDCGITRTEGEPKTESSSLVWMGVILVILLGAAAAALLLLIPRLRKKGKYGK